MNFMELYPVELNDNYICVNLGCATFEEADDGKWKLVHWLSTQ